jgi:hypothetical protein
MDSLPTKVLAQDSFEVTFPCGSRAWVFGVEHGRWAYDASWPDGARPQRPDLTYPNQDRALRAAWCAIYRPPAPVGRLLKEVHSLALSCDHNNALFTRALKEMLRERTGEAFSVAKLRGGGSWVAVREAGGRELSPRRQALLVSLFPGLPVTPQGLEVRPCGGERVQVICMAAGEPLPEGFTVGPHGWD